MASIWAAAISRLPYYKIIVIAKADDEKTRKQYELALVEKLQKKGVNAIASYLVFPNRQTVQI